MDTLACSIHFDLTTWARGAGGYRWECAHCDDEGAAETARAAEVLAQAHADVHGVRRGW